MSFDVGPNIQHKLTDDFRCHDRDTSSHIPAHTYTNEWTYTGKKFILVDAVNKAADEEAQNGQSLIPKHE